MRRVLAIALLAFIPSAMTGQRMGMGHFGGQPGPFHSSRFNRRFGAYGGAYVPFFDPLSWDYLPSPEHPLQPAAVMQAPPVETAAAPPAQPLMIELRGDHYVQVSGDAESKAQVIDDPEANLSGTVPKPPAHNVVLIFRDGHREEVSNYTVADGFLYASSSYYTAGAWVRKVAVAELNIPETMAANQSRGTAFRLPTAANEVVVGP